MGCDIPGVLQKKVDGTWQEMPGAFGDRSYNVFAMLANVRNGYGFAGCETSSGYEFIQEGRGLPEDFSMKDDEYHKDGTDEGFWMGDHSHGWVTAKELATFDLSRKVTRVGVIPEDKYLHCKACGSKPESWSGSISGPDIVTFEADQYDQLRANKDLPQGKRIHVRMRWESNYYNSVPKDFLEMIHAATREGLLLGDLEAVRFVFGFDS
jgi:hypothetical protein